QLPPRDLHPAGRVGRRPADQSGRHLAGGGARAARGRPLAGRGEPAQLPPDREAGGPMIRDIDTDAAAAHVMFQSFDGMEGLPVARILGLSRAFGALSGGSVGICGASAALAIASVLPKTRESERDVILAVVVVTGLSTIAMILYPMLVTAIGLDHLRAGLFLGGTIHDVAQVVGAGYMISQKTGDVATYVKLLRVAMLLPVVGAIAFAIAN